LFRRRDKSTNSAHDTSIFLIGRDNNRQRDVGVQGLAGLVWSRVLVWFSIARI
jgi:hypothetical protein